MFRPPRPPSKNTTPHTVLPPASGRQVQIGITRFIEEEYAKSVGKNVKKAQVLIQHSEQNYHTTLQSPKYSLQIKENVQANTNKTISVNPSGFKIRYLSSRGKRSKENIQPNQTKMNQHIMNIEMKQPINKPKKITSAKPIFWDDRVEEQTDIMERNYRQLQFHSAKSKTGVIKLNPSTTSKTCIIISQSILQQPTLTDNFINQLKTLLNTITSKQQQISIALKLQTNRNISSIRQLIQNNNLPINYIIWNNQRTISSYNVISLEKICQLENFIVFQDVNQYCVDWYATGNVDSKYCYFTGNLQQIIKAFCHFKIQQDINNHTISVTYNKNSSITNITQQHLHSPQILNKIKLSQNKILTRSTSMPTCISTTTTNTIKQFDEQYRNKMIQLAKLLMTESQQKQEENRVSRYSGIGNGQQYLKIKLKDQVALLMDTNVACNTAYQFVSEIVRNNNSNWKQIADFRDKCKNLA